MTLSELKEFLRENLKMDVVFTDPYGPDLSVKVALRFKDESEGFGEDYITIPGWPNENR